MSRSFMDTIRGVVSEGVNDKTSDGMTKDAKKFAQDLHKATDPGMKHLVQKDSETKDYEKMFSGNVDKAPTRLADLEPSEGKEKYAEYNEEAAEEDADLVAEAGFGLAPYSNIGAKTSRPPVMVAQANAPTATAPAVQPQIVNRAAKSNLPVAPQPQTVNRAAKTDFNPQTVNRAAKGNMQPPKPTFKPTAIAAAPKPKLRPVAPVIQPASSTGVNPMQAATPAKPMTPAKPTFKGNWKGAAPTAMQAGKKINRSGVKQEGYEVEVDGTTYLVSEAHAQAIAAFVEKYGQVNEVLTKSTTAGETIKDFVHSKNPKFKGKSKEKRMQMALAAYYSKQREK